MKPIIEAHNLSKLYNLGMSGATTMHESIKLWWGKSIEQRGLSCKRVKPANRDENNKDFLWALRDVAFTVNPGEVIGVIGKNGSGKSTLLKILSKITEPTSGHAIIRGRVASLLEVGTGFHPELSGRENVYLNGTILGMRKVEIDRKFEEIISFAEVERFVDTPVKHYSSGMYVRLAFSIAAHLDPEILLVDEILAVGDGPFQSKCLSKMGDISKGGRTILFVSHNMNAISRLCQRSLLFDAGRLVAIGGTADVLMKYTSITEHPFKGIPGKWINVASMQRAMGTGEVRFEAVKFDSENEKINSYHYPDGPVNYDLILNSDQQRKLNCISVVHYDKSGTKLVNGHTLSLTNPMNLCKGRNLVRLRLKNLHLNPGVYQIGLWASNFLNAPFDYIEPCIEIEVMEDITRRNYVKPQGDGLVTCEMIVLGVDKINS